MKISNLFRISIYQFSALLSVAIALGCSYFIQATIQGYASDNDEQKKILTEKKKENKKYEYVEGTLKEFKQIISDYRGAKAPDVFSLARDIESLIPNGIVITNLNIGKDLSITIDGEAPNGRSIDLLISILSEYKDLHSGVKDFSLNASDRSEDGSFKFSIKGSGDRDKMIKKIYTDDMDGDGVKDYEIKNFAINGVEEKRKVAVDRCPMTPLMNVIIGKMLKKSSEGEDGSMNDLSLVFPAYSDLRSKGYFDFDESTGCLKAGDVIVN